MKTVAGVCMALLLGGCSAAGNWLGGATPLRVEEVGNSSSCGISGAETTLQWLGKREAVQAWQTQSGIELLPEGAVAGSYVLISMGQRSSGGYGVTVSRDAQVRDGRVQLQGTFFAPKAGQMNIQMITSPCVLVRLPEGAWRAVEVSDQTGRLRASAERAE